ncbi:serine/threonine-protein kinase [Wenzhouxiangella marina]|uniref:non-specific serine/threonine protein kinase n=1 Tax=Wenzhouxiangella marina TaxID=1579979 RepID=A0A0K0XZU5_9GAMM|nr:serine/threonine-protein kinase [Wenzhouxiangella marina]AKS43151.1 hypothetical protein WM2015_2794 [Wenzhouxiangella marina]MBB6087164.1 serine/threonine-protein kinase [Wenzhouxiangella marina]
MSESRIDWHTGVPLAQGGNGEVVRAYSPDLGRDIAIKYLRQEDPAAIERMLREARTQRALSHPHILPIHATGVHLDRHYIAMELVDGAPLDRYLADRSTELKLAVFDQVLDAMAHAHAQGVVHRDLKPGNLMVEEGDGRPQAWVMDFGLARRPDDATLTMAGDALGTPGYMAPEQARGAEGADPRADVYALGVVLYEVLTGALPYTADTPMALVMQAAAGQTVPVSEIRRRLPEGLARIVVRCLETEPARRYADAGELRADLAAFSAGQVIAAPVLGRRYRFARWMRSNPWRARSSLALGAVVLIGAASLVVMAEQNRRALSTASELIAEAERARGDWHIEQLLPLHDQRAALAEARETVDRLAATRDQLSEAASARIDAALADLLDAIGEPARAFEHAERAWRGGVRTTSVANRAARARLQQFGARRLELGLTADAASLAELQALERDALASDLEPYRSLLGADLRQRIERALDAEGAPTPNVESQAETPLLSPDDWQNALLDLQAETVRRIDQLNVAPDEALAALEDVDVRLEDLRRTARSYLPVYQLGCTIAAARQSLQTMQTEDAAIDTSRQACDQGLQLIADDSELLATSSMQLWLRAKDLLRDRQPLTEPLNDAIAQARRALELDPDNELAQLSLGSALQVLGRKQLAEGEDPEAALEASLRWLERVHQARPNDVNVMNNLAVTWSTIASAGLGEGGSRAALEAERQSVNWLRAASAVTPGDRRLMHNMLASRGNVAYQDALLGRDPTEELTVIIRGLEELVEQHPDYISPLNTLGLNWWTLGLWQALIGQDPAPAMGEARSALERAMELRPDWDSPRINHAGVARQWFALSDTPPSPALTALADQALASYRGLEDSGLVDDDEGPSELGCLISEVLVARARWSPPAQAQALLLEAEALSRLDRNIDWMHGDCQVARARLGPLWISHRLDADTLAELWNETRSASEDSDHPLLLIAAQRFARTGGHEASASELTARIPEAFRHRILAADRAIASP